jgi:hypothetical protein
MKHVVSALIAFVTIVCHASAYAQVGDGTVSFTAAQEYVADAPRGETVKVPDNISAPPMIRELLETMIAHSGSFRRQCVRIAAERALTIHIRHVPVRLPGGIRAVTRISRPSEGRIVAHVVLHPFDNYVEMIAHELEHIIEQIDAVDLAEKARRGHIGVRVNDGPVFETRRAWLTGRAVAEELRRTSAGGKL